MGQHKEQGSPALGLTRVSATEPKFTALMPTAHLTDEKTETQRDVI